MHIDLSGKTALITGATRGIGKSVADVFIAVGAKVILTGTNPDEISQLNANETGNSEIEWIEADFSSIQGVINFLNRLEENINIDICVNNAGINIIKPFTEYSVDELSRLVNIDLAAPFMVTQRLIPGMKARGFGRVVNIASIWSEISKAERSLYTMAKAGLAGLTRTLAVEYSQYNVLVNAVSPGFTKTELTAKSLTALEIEMLSKNIPAGRLAEPIEIARTVLFLCSELNSYISGQNIVVDGGYTIV